MFSVKMKFPDSIKPDKKGRIINLVPEGYWTKDGKKIPKSDFKAPEGANDVDLIFVLVGVQFTKDGKPIGKVNPTPKGANDVHVELKQRPKVSANH